MRIRNTLTAAATLALLHMAPSAAGQLQTIFSVPGGGVDVGSVSSTGVVYGAFQSDGISTSGTIFSLTPPPTGKTAWAKKTLVQYATAADNLSAYGPVAAGTGLFTTVTSNIGANCGKAFEILPTPAPHRAQFIWSFTGFNHNDGCVPGPLVADSAGNLYGTSLQARASEHGGTVFEISPPAPGATAWTEHVLHFFNQTGQGYFPFGKLTIGPDGSLYGMTLYGGTGGNLTAFRLVPPASAGAAWSFTSLYTFPASVCTFARPPLVLDGNGNIYGACFEGGSTAGGGVFELSPPATGQTAWTETAVYSFNPATEGSFPNAIVRAPDGTLYGTLQWAAGQNVNNQTGAIFALVPPTAPASGWTFQPEWTFTGGAGGGTPQQLLLTPAGLLAGSTVKGGTTGNGTLFELAP
jgi:hypothetical protein